MRIAKDTTDKQHREAHEADKQERSLCPQYRAGPQPKRR
jgi:hypothetical protein